MYKNTVNTHAQALFLLLELFLDLGGGGGEGRVLTKSGRKSEYLCISNRAKKIVSSPSSLKSVGTCRLLHYIVCFTGKYSTSFHYSPIYSNLCQQFPAHLLC